jgi:hypothetical protein
MVTRWWSSSRFVSGETFFDTSSNTKTVPDDEEVQAKKLAGRPRADREGGVLVAPLFHHTVHHLQRHS